MGKIVLLVAREEMLFQAHNILQEKKYEIASMKVIRTEDSVSEAREAIAKGASIIIARGRQASLIRQYTDIPVAEITVTAQEMALLVTKARQILNKPHPVIAVIGTRNMFCDMSYFDLIYDIELRTYLSEGDKDLKNMVDQAIAQEPDLIIGGDTAVETAVKAGLPSLFLSATEDSLRNAFRIAERMDFAMEAEKRSAAQMETVLDYSTNGVIRLDQQGNILSVNPAMEMMAGKAKKELEGKRLDQVFPEILERDLKAVLVKGEENYSWIIHAGQTSLMAFAAPVSVEGGIEGGIITCQRLKKRENQREKERSKERTGKYIAMGDFRDLQADSYAMEECIKTARLYARSESPVTIVGEGGTEYSLIAACIHNAAMDISSPFVSVSCCEISEEKQKSAVFGPRGAGAAADKGTLYLENAESLGREGQYALYRLIRFGQLSGAAGPEGRAKVRVILHFEENPGQLAAKGMWNQELYFLISSLTLYVPPARRRKEDLKKRMEEAVQYACQKYSKYHVLTEGAWKALMAYHWPGNFIQAEGFAESLILTAEKRSLDERTVKNHLELLYPGEYLIPGKEPGISLYEREIPVGKSLEKESIIKLLEENGGSREKAAKALKISKTTLWRRMKKYGICQ